MAGRHSEQTLFHWADYLVFALILVLSAAVGVYYGIQDRRLKQNNLDHFLLAGRKMSILPVTISLFVSMISAMSFLGDPVDVYYNGAVYILLPTGYVIILPIVAVFFAPRFNKMNIYSANEFIGQRYNRPIRVIVSIVLGTIGGLYCGMVIYGPAIALSQASGLDNWISMLIVGFVCMFYTTLGGMKAVLWTDTFQILVMFCGFVALLVRGSMAVGGVGEVWKIAEREGRINILNFNPSPFVRSTFWTYLIGGCFRLFTPLTSQQAFIQRYCSLKDAKSAKLAVLLTIPLYIIFGSMFTLMGLVMLAYFDGCDPMMYGHVQRKDQMIPFMVLELLGFVPGLSGLFLGSVFCAALSSLSSYMNSLSLTLLKDIVEPAYASFNRKPMSSKMSLGLSKVFCVILGMLFIGLALVIHGIEDASMFELSFTMFGLFSGPVSALFVLGLYVPFVKFRSAITGILIGLAICMWWYLGSILVDLGPSRQLHVSVENCTMKDWGHINDTRIDLALSTEYNFVQTDFKTTPEPQIYLQSGVSTLYRFSPFLFAGLGFCVTFLVAVVVGFADKLVIRWKSRGSEDGKNNHKTEAEDVSAHMLKEY